MTPVQEIQEFILARLDETDRDDRWQAVLDKRLVRLHTEQAGGCTEGCAHLPCGTLTLMAMRWPYHPDYKPDWIFC